jgi:hypothetical protein
MVVSFFYENGGGYLPFCIPPAQTLLPDMISCCKTHKKRWQRTAKEVDFSICVSLWVLGSLGDR